MSRLIVVSNRVALPRETRAGGLAAAMQAALAENGGIWFGWSGKVSDNPGPPSEQSEGPITYVTVDLPRDAYEAYYNGFANRTLWPLLHYRLDLVDYRRDTYRGYQRVNRAFARMLAPMIKNDDLIWVQDYHLIPLAALLREEGVTARIGFFLHTPLPPPDLIVALPGHRALMESLTDYDLVGFQTESDRQACVDYLQNLAGGSVTYDDFLTMPSGTRTLVSCIPISIDRDLVAQQASRASQQVTVRRLRESLLGRWPCCCRSHRRHAVRCRSTDRSARTWNASRARSTGGSARPTGCRCATSTAPTRRARWPASTGPLASDSSLRCATA